MPISTQATGSLISTPTGGYREGGYFKVYRPKQQRATEAVEEDYGDELDAFDDLEDDTPPWDEDEV